MASNAKNDIIMFHVVCWYFIKTKANIAKDIVAFKTVDPHRQTIHKICDVWLAGISMKIYFFMVFEFLDLILCSKSQFYENMDGKLMNV